MPAATDRRRTTGDPLATLIVRLNTADAGVDRRMRRLARALSRLPIRVRLTLAFTGVIALALLVAGGFLARELRRDLDRSIDEAQRVEAQDVAALVAGPGGPSKLSQSGERFAQVFGAGESCSPPPPRQARAACSTAPRSNGLHAAR